MLLHTTSSLLPGVTSKASLSRGAIPVAVLLLLGAMSCEKVPLTAPAGTVITLVPQTTIVPLNGSTEIIAVLVENGTSGTGPTGTGAAGTPVHNGTLVTFTTSLGRVEPAEARTTNGRASVTLLADGRSGTATISAFSGSATKTTEIKIGAAAVERVAVTASPSSVPANGGTATISARVEDLSGNPLAGVPVTFTTTAGTLSAQSVLTNDSGFAATSLSTTTEASVTASSGGKTSAATVIKVRSRSTIALVPPAAGTFVGAPAVFTVRPGTTVAFKDVVIDFGDGESQQLGAISSDTPVTHYFSEDGIFLVTVSGTDVDGGVAVASAGVGLIPISFTAASSPTSALKNQIFVFSVANLPATVPIDRYVWNFGDGQVQTTAVASTTHAYTTAGIKTVTVTVYPRYGASKSHTFQVVVTEPA